ncbi:O-fucosyltransferase 2 isoform X2 [Tachypleus tridentatus]|uniref:O-fucosyltransferase 2 isoform X2 n=1 Tax=Tachypleus tridentatus TaxID=6853 RepID=UPI003FD31CE5
MKFLDRLFLLLLSIFFNSSVKFVKLVPEEEYCDSDLKGACETQSQISRTFSPDDNTDFREKSDAVSSNRFSKEVDNEKQLRNEEPKHIYHPIKRYILYDVNPGEGFNLRRDVYMRLASFVNKLRQEQKNETWILVLPPWGPLYHWQSRDLGPQFQIPWSLFFDLSSLNKYVPVMEFKDYLNENGPFVEKVYHLQHYAEGWKDGQWEEKYDVRDCINEHSFWEDETGNYTGWFWGYSGIQVFSFTCLSVQGHASTLKPLVKNSKVGSIMFDRAEVVLHDHFGDQDFWKVRRSMRFAKHLHKIGDEFRRKFLNSSDETDGTPLHDDWQMMKTKPGQAVGGPYVAVHLRRKDFLRGRPKEVPSLKHAAEQVQKILHKLKLNTTFVATDAPQKEFMEFKKYLPGAIKYNPPQKVRQQYLDGGVAIIDQWICAHAKYFIGTYESTFSFRIQDEREILGFDPDTTFNRLCGNGKMKCEQPSRWRIIY